MMARVMPPTMNQRHAFLLAMTKLANLIKDSPSLSDNLILLLGSRVTSAGKKEIESRNEISTPTATSVPRWLNGGTSEKFIVRKPIAVVTLARKMG